MPSSPAVEMLRWRESRKAALVARAADPRAIFLEGLTASGIDLTSFVLFDSQALSVMADGVWDVVGEPCDG